jgi:hypothetical protein
MANEESGSKQQIDEARKVLFELYKDGGIVGKSKLYKTNSAMPKLMLTPRRILRPPKPRPWPILLRRLLGHRNRPLISKKSITLTIRSGLKGGKGRTGNRHSCIGWH